ncbi:MAG TPA: hypothetical protein VE421_02360 [Burkholderiaceae bacterium]|nr:hypothetical protein [Burkholderiaceae bacterium]
MPSVDAQAPKQSGGAGQTKPTPKVYACGGQLTRTADKIITMEAGKAFYKSTVDDAPVTTAPTGDLNSITAAEAKARACTRRVIEIRVPSTTSSGCADCYPNAEIHTCAGSFSGSKEFEEHCRVPVSSTPLADCKTFSHPVAVYKKAAGANSFSLAPIKNFNYRGFIDSSGCRVAAKNLGQIYDTAEVFANVTPPTSGTDVYRVLTLPKYKNALLDSVIFIEFEKKRR